MLALCLALSSAFTLPSSRAVGRREAISAAAAAVTFGTALPALADPVKDAELFQDEDKNADGFDAVIYTPSVKVEAAGASNSKLAVVTSGVRSKGDYVDCMWFRDADNFRILGAEAFGSNGRSREFSLRDDTGVDPSYSVRIKSGTTVVPMMHAAKGGTWEGKPFKVK